MVYCYIAELLFFVVADGSHELVYIVSSLFGFEKPYMEGYFSGNYDVDNILELCMMWLPVHAWSHGMLAEIIGPAAEITSFAVMRNRLRDWLARATVMCTSKE